jgi:hypothetical protein
MENHRLRHWGLTLIALACTAGLASAQMTITGTVTGTVVDPTAQVVAGAKITFTSIKTGDVRTGTTNEVGSFNLGAIQPDVYNLRIQHAGFKVYERKGLNVSANERIALGDLTLQIGDVTETVSVTATAAQLQTDSSESSAALTSNQLQNLTARGRDVVSMMRTIPGVQYQADQDSVGGSYGTSTPNIGGSFSSTNILAVDGVVSNDVGTPSVFSSVTTMDAIGEVKVILNSYQAEYAGNGGAIMQVVSKSGGKEYHGGLYNFLRNDALNANDFFNNRNSVRRPRYRYNTIGGSIGGPI